MSGVNLKGTEMSKYLNASILGLSLAAAAALAVAAPASAEPLQIVKTVITVPYGDLNLDHADGARALLNRIRSAAVRACGGESDVRDLDDRHDFDACRKVAIGEAVARVDAPILTAMADVGAHTVRIATR
jgi:UrcA family protein